MKHLFVLWAALSASSAMAQMVPSEFICTIADNSTSEFLYRESIHKPRTGEIFRFKTFGGMLIFASFDENEDIFFQFEIDAPSRDKIAYFRFNTAKLLNLSKPAGGEAIGFTNPVTGDLTRVNCALMWKLP